MLIINLKNLRPILGFCFCCFSAVVYSESAQRTFQHKDWELACDNTGTCRAAGYQTDVGDEVLPASLYLERAAGPNKPVKMSIAVYEPNESKDFKFPTELTIDGKLLKQIGKPASKADQSAIDLNSATVDALIELLPNSKSIVLRWKKLKWEISLEGVKAVLTKMDDWQGRAGTVGALVAKGSKDESNVPKGIPIPVITVPKIAETTKIDESLGSILFKLVKNEECAGGYGQASTVSDYGLVRLDKSNLLFFNFNCFRGAYNQSGPAWLVKDKKPFVLQDVGDEGFNDYSLGTLFLSHKGRGIGDCFGTAEWAWNGKTFVKTRISTSGMCKGFPGGAWDMPTYVSKVNNLNVQK